MKEEERENFEREFRQKQNLRASGQMQQEVLGGKRRGMEEYYG